MPFSVTRPFFCVVAANEVIVATSASASAELAAELVSLDVSEGSTTLETALWAEEDSALLAGAKALAADALSLTVLAWLLVFSAVDWLAVVFDWFTALVALSVLESLAWLATFSSAAVVLSLATLEIEKLSLLVDAASEVVDKETLSIAETVSALAVCVAINVPAATATVVKAMQHHFLPFLNILKCFRTSISNHSHSFIAEFW